MGDQGKIVVLKSDHFSYKILLTIGGAAVIISFLSMYILFYALSYSVADVDLSYLDGMSMADSEEAIVFEYENSFNGYVHWLTELFHGNTKTIEFQVPIKVFSSGETLKPVGLIFFKTIGSTFLCLLSGIFISLLLNLKIIYSSDTLAKVAAGINSILSLTSGIHVIIIAIIFLGVFDNASQDVPNILLALIVIIGSNIYYDISSFQSVTLQRLKNSDYILAAKAWGDSTFRHMRRTIGIMLLNQISSSWSHILTNVIIVEIMFQRGGLGFELFKQIFSGESMYPDISVILAISVLAILSIQLVSAIREITKSALKTIR